MLYLQHSPKFNSRHQPLDIIVEYHNAAKVFDGSNEAMRADPWPSITVVSEQRK